MHPQQEIISRIPLIFYLSRNRWKIFPPFSPSDRLFSLSLAGYESIVALCRKASLSTDNEATMKRNCAKLHAEPCGWGTSNRAPPDIIAITSFGSNCNWFHHYSLRLLKQGHRENVLTSPLENLLFFFFFLNLTEFSFEWLTGTSFVTLNFSVS